MINVGKRACIFWFLTCILLVSCSSKLEPQVNISATPEIQVTPTLSPTSTDTFQVDAWVDDPAPSREARVILSGSLIKDGIYLGGIMMRATWPDETDRRGSPNCYVMVLYQRGLCTFDASNFPPGEFVSIQISFEYQGKTFYGQTGFTPK